MESVLYARVSTREQEREGYSIQQQMRLIRDYAKKKGCRIVKEFIDIESARKTGRKNFNEMIGFVKNTPSIETVICHKVDRLCRNFRDFITIDDLRVKPLFVEEEFPDNASGKLTYGMKVLLAKHYCDNLSDEVRKGQLGKLEEGGFPGGCSPYGYKKINTELVPEEPYASYVKKIFDIYLTDCSSTHKVADKARKLGFVTRKGKSLTKSLVHVLLSNAIYCGYVPWAGKLYPGKHKPLVSKEIYQKTKSLLQRKGIAHPTNHDFAYSGIMHCGECGCGITAEEQKGHNYYHCSFYYKCSQHYYVREENIEGQILAVLGGLRIGEEPAEIVKKKIIANRGEEDHFRLTQLDNLQKQVNAMNEWIDKLYDDKMGGVIDEEMYQRKNKDYSARRDEAEGNLETFKNSGFDTFELSVNLVDLANRACEIYKKREAEEKRLLLRMLLSNPVLRDKKLKYSLNNPFNWFVVYGKTQNWSECPDSNRGPLLPKSSALPTKPHSVTL